MDIEEFLLEMADSDECRRINYKRLAIRKYIGVYYAQKPVSGEIDSFMIPFRDYVRHKIEEHGIDIDVLAKYMISTDESNCALFAFTTRFKPKNSITSYQYYDAIAQCHVNGNSDVFIEFMLSMIDQALDEVILQVNKTNESMSEYVKRMLEVMEYDVPYTANAIMEALHLKSKETFRKNYIKPAIELGLVKMTLPEKPNSKNQRYVKQ